MPTANRFAVGAGRPEALKITLGQRQFKLRPILEFYYHDLLYTMRRVSKQCNKIVIEKLLWATGKSPITKEFTAVLVFWVRNLSWQETPHGQSILV